MSFRIQGLAPAPFQHLYDLDDGRLAELGVKRMTVDSHPGYPDRIGLCDVPVGETVLLLNHVHQPADTPYRASHAIFVREGAREAAVAIDTVPDALRHRIISLRAFDANHMMVDADLVEGRDLGERIEGFFANPEVSYLQAHYAKRGCYAARVERN
ncbi:DUF1203 domain-containing protein [Arenimonas sp.]|uniref:DUF1203 domain-containing protein n=1 Tax=Arenimonas sp. TaxID=1872635 RepID=UPI0039E226CC